MLLPNTYAPYACLHCSVVMWDRVRFFPKSPWTLKTIPESEHGLLAKVLLQPKAL